MPKVNKNERTNLLISLGSTDKTLVERKWPNTGGNVATVPRQVDPWLIGCHLHKGILDIDAGTTRPFHNGHLRRCRGRTAYSVELPGAFLRRPHRRQQDWLPVCC